MSRGFGEHDKHLLILVYKILFQKKYPTSKYMVIFEPKLSLSLKPHFRPDILIVNKKCNSQKEVDLKDVVLWIEVGQLNELKHQFIFHLLKGLRFIHISYNHSIFNLLDENTLYFQNLNEKTLLWEALNNNRFSLVKTAQEMGLTYRALRYKLEKFNLKRQKHLNIYRKSI